MKMKLTKEQKEFLNEVCYGRIVGQKWTLNSEGKVDVEGSVKMFYMNLTEIPIKFGKVTGNFDCSENNLTTLENCPTFVGGNFICSNNNLTDYFKSIKEKDFSLWKNLVWGLLLQEYPFLINIWKGYFSENRNHLKFVLETYPLTKLYYEG